MCGGVDEWWSGGLHVGGNWLKDDDATDADDLPEKAVPDVLLQSATHMPEASNIKTTRSLWSECTR